MSNLNHNPNQPPDFQQGQSIVTLADTDGHTLACYVEKAITIHDSGQEYLLLLPVAATWEECSSPLPRPLNCTAPPPAYATFK